jgi:hypothetical protein
MFPTTLPDDGHPDQNMLCAIAKTDIVFIIKESFVFSCSLLSCIERSFS